jgi:elongation factor Ts
MADITASLVKELRDATNVSMMECKRSLVETDGDIEKATRLLREKGIAIASKRASKETKQGIIASASADGNTSLIEVNCETDFVARNEDFQAFVNELAVKACSTEDNALAEAVKDELMDKIAAIGENIVIRRNTRLTQEGTGIVIPYIHLGAKVGVLVQVTCGKSDTLTNETFQELTKDLALHIAACNPDYLNSSEVPESEIASEREIFAKQVENKPPEILDRIVDGKIKKFYSEICLLNQGFVKEDKVSIEELLADKGKELDDTVTIKSFVRYQLGE